MRRVVVIAIGMVLAFAGPALASGDDGPGASVGPNGDPVVFVERPGADPVGSPSGTGSVVCRLYDVTPGQGVQPIGAEPASDPVEGSNYLLECHAVPGGDLVLAQIITYQPGVNVITPGSLAQQALKELPLIYPRPRLAPPANQPQITGIRTWMWVDPADWHPISATASVPGLAATVTAEPVRTIWNMGDGTAVTCDGPPTVYDNNTPDADQHSNCTHVYQHAADEQPNGVYPVRVTIVWNVTWTATTGDGGTLGLFQRSTQFPVAVEQRQAVIDG